MLLPQTTVHKGDLKHHVRFQRGSLRSPIQERTSAEAAEEQASPKEMRTWLHRGNLCPTRHFGNDGRHVGTRGKALQSAGPRINMVFFFKNIKFVGNKSTNCRWLSSLELLMKPILPKLFTFKCTEANSGVLSCPILCNSPTRASRVWLRGAWSHKSWQDKSQVSLKQKNSQLFKGDAYHCLTKTAVKKPLSPRFLVQNMMQLHKNSRERHRQPGSGSREWVPRASERTALRAESTLCSLYKKSLEK